MDSLYIYKKEIDWSAMHEGISIPVSIQLVFYDGINFYLKKGESRNTTILFEGKEYSVTLKNQVFNLQKYHAHTDILQIRYSKNSDFSKQMRMTFYNSYNHLKSEREKSQNKGKQIKVPDDIREYMVLYTTDISNIFLMESITFDEIKDAKNIISGYDELYLEDLLKQKDTTSTIIEKQKLVKVRKLDRAIGDNLKMFYNYRCQICGKDCGSNYNIHLVEAHHITPFSLSMNNDVSNIMIICPNHHEVIHIAKPVFNRSKLAFEYSNGFLENLVINLHL